jgi:predicted aconitase with swiveling domain
MSGIKGRPLVEGTAQGTVLHLREPLSFWGGLDPATGEIIDPHHPQRGAFLPGKIVLMPSGRGSSSSSSVLAEAIRAGSGPAAIVMTTADAIVSLGAMIAAELYDIVVPIVVIPANAFQSVPDGVEATIDMGVLRY